MRLDFKENADNVSQRSQNIDGLLNINYVDFSDPKQQIDASLRSGTIALHVKGVGARQSEKISIFKDVKVATTTADNFITYAQKFSLSGDQPTFKPVGNINVNRLRM